MSHAATARRLVAPRHAPEALVDASIALTAFAGSLAQLAHEGGGPLESGPNHLDALGGVLTACATLPLVAWRRNPAGVFALTAAVSVLLGGLGYGLPLPLGPTAALYLLVASRPATDPWTRRDGVVTAGLFTAYLAATWLGGDGAPGSAFLHTGLAWAVAWFAGERSRLRHAHMLELHERAMRSDREAERDRRLAAAEERTRIARDLHDSVGHAINVIAIRAGAARLRHAQDPDRSLGALTAIESIARQTAGDVDEIVAALREPQPANGAPRSPIALASLPTLVEHSAAGGLDVAVRTSGEVQPLAHAADQAAYRILQEALANAARHGAGSAVVELRYTAAALELTVTNPIRDGLPERNGGGHGLTGMRERARLLGGTLEAGSAGREFRLRARLPYARTAP